MKTREEIEAIALKKYPNVLDYEQLHYSVQIIREASRRAFIEGYEQSQNDSQWISVEERLPDLDVQVWVWLKDHKEPYLFSRSKSGFNTWLWANHYKEIDGDGYFDDDYEVTHWMPFVKPPTPTK